MDYALKIDKVYKAYRNFAGRHTEVLADINLQISPGEFFVLLGPSGCGKSTLLRLASGLDKEFTGQVSLGAGLKTSDINFVFQQFAILPWLTVEENVDLGLLSRPISENQREQMVVKELKTFGLEKYAKHYPKELSGGQKQRVGLARAFVAKPQLLFMDEPFSALDSFISKELREELLRVWQERKPTIIMVTHNINEAIELGDRIAVMSSRPGKIEKIITNPLSRPRPMRGQQVFDLEDELYKLVKP
jgi:ABC-type nitrate/sulfonate/bicarbonate transport system ATPase subunit